MCPRGRGLGWEPSRAAAGPWADASRGLLQIRTEGPPSNGTRDAGSMVTGQGVQTERNQCWDWRNGPGKTGGPRAGAPGCVGASPSHPDLTANSSRAFPMSGYFHPQGRNIKTKLFYFCVAFHLIIKDYDYIRERKYSKNTISWNKLIS